MRITQEILEQGRSSRGGWSNKQLKALGLPDIWINPKDGGLKKDWKKWLLSSEVPIESIERFLSLKDKHLKPKQQLEVQDYNKDYPWLIEGVNDNNRKQWLAMIHRKNPWLKVA